MRMPSGKFSSSRSTCPVLTSASALAALENAEDTADVSSPPTADDAAASTEAKPSE